MAGGEPSSLQYPRYSVTTVGLPCAVLCSAVIAVSLSVKQRTILTWVLGVLFTLDSCSTPPCSPGTESTKTKWFTSGYGNHLWCLHKIKPRAEQSRSAQISAIAQMEIRVLDRHR